MGHQINECPFTENNVRQGFTKHFQNLNLELARAKNYGYNESMKG
jgi:ribosome modulation factor